MCWPSFLMTTGRQCGGGLRRLPEGNAAAFVVRSVADVWPVQIRVLCGLSAASAASMQCCSVILC